MIKYIENRLLCPVLVFVVVLALVMTTSMAKAENNKYCEKDGYTYFKMDEVTCCKKKSLKNPIASLHTLRLAGKCAKSIKEVDGDDLPTSIYREYRCLLDQSGATADDLATLPNYLKYMTQHYEESVKSVVLQNGEKCEGVDSKKDELNRLADFYNCFIQVEKEICLKPNNKTKDPTFYGSSEEICKRNESIASISCCKGKKIPEGVTGIHYLTLESNLNQNKSLKSQCMKSFRQRQDELFNASNPGSGTQSCSDACDLRLANYISKTDLTVDFEAIKRFSFPEFSKSTQQELGNIFDKYMAKKLFVMSDNSTVSLNGAAKWMQDLDELSHIKMYCRLHSYALYLLYAVTSEYCTGVEWAKNLETKEGNRIAFHDSHFFDLTKPSWL